MLMQAFITSPDVVTVTIMNTLLNNDDPKITEFSNTINIPHFWYTWACEAAKLDKRKCLAAILQLPCMKPYLENSENLPAGYDLIKPLIISIIKANNRKALSCFFAYTDPVFWHACAKEAIATKHTKCLHKILNTISFGTVEKLDLLITAAEQNNRKVLTYLTKRNDFNAIVTHNNNAALRAALKAKAKKVVHYLIEDQRVRNTFCASHCLTLKWAMESNNKSAVRSILLDQKVQLRLLTNDDTRSKMKCWLVEAEIEINSQPKEEKDNDLATFEMIKKRITRALGEPVREEPKEAPSEQPKTTTHAKIIPGVPEIADRLESPHEHCAKMPSFTEFKNIVANLQLAPLPSVVPLQQLPVSLLSAFNQYRNTHMQQPLLLLREDASTPNPYVELTEIFKTPSFQ